MSRFRAPALRSVTPLLIAATASLVAVAAHAVPPNYRVDVIGAGLSGFDMNEAGTIVGRQLSASQIG
jgi:hypothetical protein